MSKEEKMVEIKEMIDKETGEIKESIVIHRPEEVDHIIVRSKEEQKLHEAFMQAEKYRIFGKRKDPFVQTMPPYEKGIVGTYSAKQLECLMKLLPYILETVYSSLTKFVLPISSVLVVTSTSSTFSVSSNSASKSL